MEDTIVDRLFVYAEHTPNKKVYRYLERGERLTDGLNYSQLCARTVDISAALMKLGYGNCRAMLLFGHPLEFIQAFLGCLAAGVTAVPVAVPSAKNADALAGIFRDAGISCILSGQREYQQLGKTLEEQLGSVPWHCLDELLLASSSSSIANKLASLPRITDDHIAFLQYTSGSTGVPKGVIVSHGNLMANEAVIRDAMRMHRDSVVLSWLPHYHDMGLIGGLLQPLYSGAECILMRPVDFIQKPIRWLRAISDFGATVSGGPNFAFDLCVDKTNEAQREGLDLSSWEIAFSGAEPVKASTVSRFADTFARHKLKRTSIYPCYGMAESTLFVSGEKAGTEPSILSFSAETLTIGSELKLAVAGSASATPFVSCGASNGDARIRIVHPETCTILPENHVGEIWLRSPSVAKGYHNNPEATARTFGATIVGGTSECYLRTGDLGTLHRGQLVILGRIKDVLIVRGRNYYPQDIETAAQKSHIALAPNGGAVFQRPYPFDDHLVLVHELTRQSARLGELDHVAETVRGAVIEQHGITLAKIVFVRPGQLPRTTSGKPRRSLCREMFERNEFVAIDDAEQMELEA